MEDIFITIKTTSASGIISQASYESISKKVPSPSRVLVPKVLNCATLDMGGSTIHKLFNMRKMTKIISLVRLQDSQKRLPGLWVVVSFHEGGALTVGCLVGRQNEGAKVSAGGHWLSSKNGSWFGVFEDLDICDHSQRHHPRPRQRRFLLPQNLSKPGWNMKNKPYGGCSSLSYDLSRLCPETVISEDCALRL
ncbi:hypothetical protein Cgig2_022641 [Carnegiea gigantea]|uniref:Uncharacterized protein n=1 Tax=Carnegiea gigantea TaxID=171969 RepID=A0A9Q1GKI8_9CARY|nr:hypothetical protein Cgig2_022641 [Carnegiea gigantea]